ncbi:putative tail fiber assembly protein [Escherichia coli 2-427-07_S3_C1]|nr:putative tail fiber assembly protein [Escherichia coli 2-427-07_S3_C1]
MQIHGQMMLWLSVMMFIMNLQSIRPHMTKFVLQEKMDYPHGH